MEGILHDFLVFLSRGSPTQVRLRRAENDMDHKFPNTPSPIKERYQAPCKIDFL